MTMAAETADFRADEKTWDSTKMDWGHAWR